MHSKVHTALQVSHTGIAALQGNLFPEHTREKLGYALSHRSLRPFQKAFFSFAFETCPSS